MSKRLAVYIDPEAARRLRLHALNTGQRPGAALRQLIDKGLPPLAELAARSGQPERAEVSS